MRLPLTWLAVAVCSPASASQAVGVTLDSNLDFGSVTRQLADTSGSVAIDHLTGARTISGANPLVSAFGQMQARIIGKPHTVFAVSYTQSGQAILSNGAHRLAAVLSMTHVGTAIMPASGNLTLGIGGVVTIPPGTALGHYSGALPVTVAFN